MITKFLILNRKFWARNNPGDPPRVLPKTENVTMMSKSVNKPKPIIIDMSQNVDYIPGLLKLFLYSI